MLEWNKVNKPQFWTLVSLLHPHICQVMHQWWIHQLWS